MARCKSCGKSGWFLLLSVDGLCRKCDEAAKVSAKPASSDISQQEMSHPGQLKAPLSLSDYVGQDAIKRDLQSKIALAMQNRSILPHILLCGPGEMGKATLAYAIAGEMGTSVRGIRADDIEGPKELAAILNNLTEEDFLLIEEIDSLSAPRLKDLMSALLDFKLDLIIGQGPSAQTYRLNLPRFTLIGTTSRLSQVDKRLRRWMIVYDFAPYSLVEIAVIIGLLAKEEEVAIETDAAYLLAQHCEGSPGNAKVLLKRVCEYMGTWGKNHLTGDIARDALISFRYLDEYGASTDLRRMLSNMSGVEFEEFVANLFRKMGYVVEFTKGSGDHGIDLLMRKGDQVVVVQCKRWNAPVGEPVIRDFYGSLMNIGAHSGYVVTTATFSSQAFAFVQDKPVQLVDLDALMGLITHCSDGLRHPLDVGLVEEKQKGEEEWR